MSRRRVLFLCTGNSARSLLAEAILRDLAPDRFESLSAGSHPRGTPHPLALSLLQEYGLDIVGLRSKRWDEFAGAGQAPLDFVFTVCDNAAGEVCPVWPGQPVTAHWGVEDPAAFDGPEAAQREVFRRVYRELQRRLRLFVALPVESLDRLSLQREVARIGAGSP